MWFYYMHCTAGYTSIFTGHLCLDKDALHSTAPYDAPTRQFSYIVTTNVPALYLMLHHDQGLLYYRVEDSNVVEATHMVACYI